MCCEEANTLTAKLCGMNDKGFLGTELKTRLGAPLGKDLFSLAQGFITAH